MGHPEHMWKIQTAPELGVMSLSEQAFRELWPNGDSLLWPGEPVDPAHCPEDSLINNLSTAAASGKLIKVVESCRWAGSFLWEGFRAFKARGLKRDPHRWWLSWYSGAVWGGQYTTSAVSVMSVSQKSWWLGWNYKKLIVRDLTSGWQCSARTEVVYVAVCCINLNWTSMTHYLIADKVQTRAKIINVDSVSVYFLGNHGSVIICKLHTEHKSSCYTCSYHLLFISVHLGDVLLTDSRLHQRVSWPTC